MHLLLWLQAIILLIRTLWGYFFSSNTQSATVWFPFVTIFLILTGWLLLIVLVSVSTVVPEVAAIKMLLFYPTGFAKVSKIWDDSAVTVFNLDIRSSKYLENIPNAMIWWTNTSVELFQRLSWYWSIISIQNMLGHLFDVIALADISV